MSGIGEALNNLFPTGWLDPYGSMPLNKEYSVQIDITQVKTDDGIKITAVKTPPRASTTSVQDAINMALGMGCCEDITERGDSHDSKGNIAERRNCQSVSKENVENCQSENKENVENCQPKNKSENDDTGESDEKPYFSSKKKKGNSDFQV